MTREQYLEKRNELINAAQGFIDTGDEEEANARIKEVEALDANYEKIAKAAANVAALADKASVMDITRVSVSDEGMAKAAELDSKKATYETAFAKYMLGSELNAAEQTVFDKINVVNATQTAATHEVVIPETTKKEIFKIMGDMHPILSDVKMTFVQGDLTIIKDTNTDADAEWYDESTSVSDGALGFGTLALTGCELAKSVTVSWKLKKMAVDSFIAYISEHLAEKLGNALALSITEGKGKPGGDNLFKAQPKGIAVELEGEASTPQIVTYSSSDALDYDKIAEAFGKIKSGYLSGACVYAKNSTIWNTIATIKDQDGRPIFVPSVDGGGVGRIFGLPVKEEDAVPADEILIGNVGLGYAMNVNENITMHTEDHVKSRTTDYMTYCLVDGGVLTTKAFALIKKA